MLLSRIAAALKRRRFALAASLHQDLAMDALAEVRVVAAVHQSCPSKLSNADDRRIAERVQRLKAGHVPLPSTFAAAIVHTQAPS